MVLAAPAGAERPNVETLSLGNGLPSPTLFDLAQDSSGRIWIASRAGVTVYDGRGFQTYSTTDGLPNRGYEELEIDAGGRIWTVSKSRIQVFYRDGSAWVSLPRPPDSTTNFNWATSLAVTTADGRSFVALGTTLAGLGIWDGEAWSQYSVDEGLPSTRVTSLAVQGNRLAVGTASGLCVLAARRLDCRLGELDPRLGEGGAGLLDHRGRVWIGTEQGVSMYRELYDEGPGASPIVEIRGVEVDGELHPLSDDLVLSHRQNALSFHVDTIFFSREEEVLCRYRLAGSGEAWQGPEPLPGPLRYTHLPPGEYRLEVAAGWAGGAWSDEVVSARVVILRPWWRRWWFFAAATAVVALAVTGGHGLRTRAIRARARELEALNAELHRQMAQRRRAETERESVIAELEKRNAELERFTYTVSHDLKSPLITINGYLGLLERDTEAGDRERAGRDYEHIKGAVKQMGRLLEEVLELSRVGRLIHPSEEVSLGDLARQAADLVSGRTSAGREVRPEIASGLPAVFGDRLRLLEVMQNLLENAVKYMGDQPRPRIEVGVRHDGSEQVCFVRDNGRGIPAEYQEKIFGLFERLDQETEGTGVGLALVKRIVELHGGRIWVESEGAGRGSTFCFTLAASS